MPGKSGASPALNTTTTAQVAGCVASRPAPRGGGWPNPGRLYLRHVHCLGALRTGLLLVGDLGALGQRAITIAVDAREMDEQIAPPIVRRDEAETLVVTEPLDGS